MLECSLGHPSHNITQRPPHLRLLSSDGAFSSLCIWCSPSSHCVLNGFSPLDLKSNSTVEQELSSVAFLIWGATPWDSGAPLLWVSPLGTETFEQESSPEAPWSPSLSFNEVDIPWDKQGEDLRSAGCPEVSDVFCGAAAVGGSDFLLVLASFLLFWATASAAFFVPREWRVEEDEVFFVVHPVFFGWEDLAEEDQEIGVLDRCDNSHIWWWLLGRFQFSLDRKYSHLHFSGKCMCRF